MDDFQWNWGAGPVKDDEFRWNWAKANVDPSYKPQGPGIGSLLRAIHPDTQADAIQQMNNNLATDRANIETIAKQGARENDFVNKLYEQGMDEMKLQETMQGRKNADNRNILDAEKQYTAAPDEGSRQFWANRIKLLDPQNAESRIANLEGMRVETQKQNKLGKETLAKYSGRFKTPKEQEDAIKEVTKLYEEGDENGVKLNLDDYTKIVQTINGKLDLNTERSITAGNMRSANQTEKEIKNKNLKDKETWIKEYAKKYPGHTPDYYEERYKKAHKL